jgi:hypothetical protein
VGNHTILGEGSRPLLVKATVDLKSKAKVLKKSDGKGGLCSEKTKRRVAPFRSLGTELKIPYRYSMILMSVRWVFENLNPIISSLRFV